MRTQTLLFLGALTLVHGSLSAQTCACSGTDQLKSPDVATALSGSTVCVPDGSDWFWQEQHRGGATGGDLFDFKKGTNPIDPTEKVGTWATTGTATNSIVTHSYLGGSSFAYKVCRVGTSTDYGFCPTAGGATIMAKIKAGISGCP